MTVIEISLVFGFLLKKDEFLKLVQSKIADDSAFAEEHGFEEEDDENSEGFYEFRSKCRDSDESEKIARTLFPALPDGIRLFFNPLKHKDLWYLGVEVQHKNASTCYKPINPFNLIATHGEKLTQLFETYKAYIEEDTPILIEVPDTCTCCS